MRAGAEAGSWGTGQKAVLVRQRAHFSGDSVIQWGGDCDDLGDAGSRAAPEWVRGRGGTGLEKTVERWRSSEILGGTFSAVHSWERRVCGEEEQGLRGRGAV